MIDPMKCPQCKFNYWQTVEYICHYESVPYEDLFDETFICACGAEFRIYEENNFGDWEQEIIYYKDPNQIALCHPHGDGA